MSREIEAFTIRLDHKDILYDPKRLPAPSADLFCPALLAATSRLIGEAVGRGEAYFLRYREQEWVLRHYRRGGLVGNILIDQYLGWNPEGSRSWREWRLLAELYALGLPVPRPIAARVSRSGVIYRADLITERIPGGTPLADHLIAGPLAVDIWERMGLSIRHFHDLGVHHADMNARNILLNDRFEPFLIDFDRGSRTLRPVDGRGNIGRLRRSLDKFRRLSPVFHFSDGDWQAFLHGYGG